MEKIVPAIGWLRTYKRSDLRGDIMSAFIITALLVPQGMAYALLAGLPARYGLYASTVPAIVYALFGTSRHMPVGPPALMALLTFTSVSALAEPGTEEYISLALLLALMVGVLQLLIGLLRMGFITNFISHPVLSGFIYASAIVIILSQIGNLLGISLPAGGHSTINTVVEVGRGIGDTNPITLAIGLASIAAMVVLGRASPRVPGPLLVVAASALVVYFFGLDERGVGIVGEVPEGLPAFSIPALDLEVAGTLVTSAIVVAFVGFVESISVAKAIAAKEKYKIDSSQELKALGLANTSAAFFSGFPVAGSFSRTAVQYESGGRTQLASIFTALLILATLLFLTPLFYYLPSASLAAVIIVVVVKLIEVREIRRAFRIRHADGYTMLLTFVLTLLLGVEEGILIGASFALLAFLRRTAYPHIAELGYVEEKDAFLGLESYPEGKTHPEALIVRVDARLYFANSPFLEEWLIKEVADRPDIKWIFIDCRGVNGIDVTAIEGLEDLMESYRGRGIETVFTHMKLPVRERLERAGWDEKFKDTAGHDYHYQTTREALCAVGLMKSRKERDPEKSLWKTAAPE
ncbi:MAG: sulfate permease [Rubrobacter sp.]|nr:sulfate permease [Rubrobacter sp.]